MRFAAIGGIFGFLAVALGAFGAHVMSNHLSTQMMGVYNTAVQFQMYHALALLAVGILIKVGQQQRLLRVSGWLFAIGIVLFSGSLYALSSGAPTAMGIVTPFGGLCFLGGWVFLVVALV